MVIAHCSKLGYLIYILIPNSFIERKTLQGIDGHLIRDRMVLLADDPKMR